MMPEEADPSPAVGSPNSPAEAGRQPSLSCALHLGSKFEGTGL